MFQSFVFGLIASLTPCTIVLIPIFLYRFGMWGSEKNNVLYKELLLTLGGFILSFLTIGFLFNLVFSSPYISVFRFVIGGLLVLFGFLQLFGLYNFANSSKVNNPFLLGLLLPWFVSFSPCVIPFFGITLTSGLASGELFLTVFLFGLGLLLPSILVSIIGERFMFLLRKTTKTMASVEKYSGLLIIFAGIYLNFQIMEFKNTDLYIVSAFFAIFTLVGFYFVFIKNKLINLPNILMFISLIILSVAMFSNCKNKIYQSHLDNLLAGRGFQLENTAFVKDGYSCSGEIANCEVCKRCAILFSTSVFLGSLGFVLSYRVGKKPKVK